MPMNDTCIVQAVCSDCRTACEVTVENIPLAKFMLREQTVQVLFHDLTPEERDVILGFRSGYYLCAECWEKFDPEEEE